MFFRQGITQVGSPHHFSPLFTTGALETTFPWLQEQRELRKQRKDELKEEAARPKAKAKRGRKPKQPEDDNKEFSMEDELDEVDEEMKAERGEEASGDEAATRGRGRGRGKGRGKGHGKAKARGKAKSSKKGTDEPCAKEPEAAQEVHQSRKQTSEAEPSGRSAHEEAEVGDGRKSGHKRRQKSLGGEDDEALREDWGCDQFERTS